MRNAVNLLLLTAVLSFGPALSAEADMKKGQRQDTDSKPSQQEKKSGKTSDKKIAAPEDCDQIKSGTGAGGGVTESAAEKDCQRSQHLGAGTGTSSGTGSGKMESGSGPR